MGGRAVNGTFHPAGKPFIGIFAAVTLVLAFLFGMPMFMLGVVLTAWCAYFFRNPKRVTPTRSGVIVSPADGKIVAIRNVEPDEDLGLGSDDRVRISVFLDIFDVHVNRVPADGVVQACHYRAGTFVNASLDKASRSNERMAVIMELKGDHNYDGKQLGFVQIAGLIARRIVCNLREGDTVKAGEIYGIIRFGSRADIYLPPGLQPLVSVGQYMIGGETVLADCTTSKPARAGKKRE
jgi:phosphatidylserine decarboxylase